jgi:hypothetical protein
MVRGTIMRRYLRASTASAVVFAISMAAVVALGASTTSPVVPFDAASDTATLTIAASVAYSVMALSLLSLAWYLGRAWSAAIGGSSLPTLSALSAAVALCAFLVMVVIFGQASNREATSSAGGGVVTLVVIAIGMLSAGLSVVAALLTLRPGVRHSVTMHEPTES